MGHGPGIDENQRIRALMAVDKKTLPADGGPLYNRLIFATSPYLLQHADNPVDWYQWGDDAFGRAAAEDKPVFLSIGYATCHWCHVMAHESFADPRVAEVFNRSFICIKVDREERPDIDEQYMAVAQLMNGSGGWPLNIFMDAQRRPFFAITYVPPESRMGLPGIVQLLERVVELWHSDRQKLVASSAATIEAVQRLFKPTSGTLPDTAMADRAYRQLNQMYDGLWGGFGTAPKFPMPLYITFLIRHAKRSGTTTPLAQAEHTMRMLRQGGIYDHVGFGLHRYATDRTWLVPHFEKMLYDQALVSHALLELFQVTGKPFYLQVAEEIFTYVLGEMTSPEGGFYSGQDADTEGEEGRSYLWTPAEIEAVLGPDDAPFFCRLFDVKEKGNFEGRNILHLVDRLENLAAREGVTPELLTAKVETWRQRLFAVRAVRVQPFRDEKILSGWNGLMIAALAKGFAITGNRRYLEAATGAAACIDTFLTTSSGRLLRSYHLNQAVVPGFLEDYAFYVWGLLELHQATLDQVWLDRGVGLSRDMLSLFAGSGSGALFESGNDAEQLPVRQRSIYDGALPSGNGVAAFTFFRLGRITESADWTSRGEAIITAFMGDVAQQPLGSVNLLAACDYHMGPEVVATFAGDRDGAGELLRALHGQFLPGLAIRQADGTADEFPTRSGCPTVYLCAQGACRPPVTEVAELEALLASLNR